MVTTAGITGISRASAAALCSQVLSSVASAGQLQIAINAFANLEREMSEAKVQGSKSPLHSTIKKEQDAKKEEIKKFFQLTEAQFINLVRARNLELNKNLYVERDAQSKKENKERAQEKQLLERHSGHFFHKERINTELLNSRILSEDAKDLLWSDSSEFHHRNLETNVTTSMPLKINKMAYLPKQNSIFILAENNQLSIYDVAKNTFTTLAHVTPIDTSPAGTMIHLTPDKSRILLSTLDKFVLIEAATGQVIRSGEASLNYRMTFINNDQVIKTRGNAVELLTLSTGRTATLTDLTAKGNGVRNDLVPVIFPNGDFMISDAVSFLKFNSNGDLILQKDLKAYQIVTTIGDDLWVRKDTHNGSTLQIIDLRTLELRPDSPNLPAGMLWDIKVKELTSDYILVSHISKDHPRGFVLSKEDYENVHDEAISNFYEKSRGRLDSQLIAPDGKTLVFTGTDSQFKSFIDIWKVLEIPITGK
jgi:hypothetical protein